MDLSSNAQLHRVGYLNKLKCRSFFASDGQIFVLRFKGKELKVQRYKTQYEEQSITMGYT
jgi:hypothetical protein